MAERANSPPSRDLLMPVMTVESSVAFDLEGKPLPPGDAPPRAGPAFSACQVVYTAADSKPRPPPTIRPPTAKYGSHETLPTARPKPRLARAQSEQVEDEPKASGANRWGVLQAKTVGLPSARKDKRRAQIVAAVTRRLFSVKKKSEESGPAEAEPKAEEADDQEPEELKICARARASLKAMVSRRRRADVETQTDFSPRTVRFKEVAVGTEGLAWRSDQADERKSVATQCTRVADVVDEVYRRWWHHYGNAAPWQRWPNAVFVTQHRFVAGEDEFSDDSLDSNHEGEPKVTEGDRPCVWKVLTIASGQRFGLADSKVASLPAPAIAAVTEPPVAAKACCCRDSIDAMQTAIDGLQRRLSDRSEASCYIQLCDCRNHESERRSQATQTMVVTMSASTQCHAGQDEGRACSCALCRSHQKIKSFVFRWKNKCHPLDEVDVKFAVAGLSQSEGIKIPENKNAEAAIPVASLANPFPINLVESSGPDSASKLANVESLNEILINNNNNTKCGEGTKCAAARQQCVIPLMANNNGRTAVVGFVKDTDHQSYFLPVLAANDFRRTKHRFETEGVHEPSTQSVKDAGDFFGEDVDLSLPRSFPEIACPASDSIARQRIDAKRRHWLEIKSIILGREFAETLPVKADEDVVGVCKNKETRKRVTWRDYRGCGDLAEVRTLPARDGAWPSEGDCGNERSYEWHASRVDRENVSNNNVAPNINLTFYPFVHAKQMCDQNCRSFSSRIYLFDSKRDEKPKLFRRIFKTFDHGWEMSTSQRGKMMNMFHSRSKYYEEKLAQLSLIRERRRKGLASGSAGETSFYSRLLSNANEADSAPSHLSMRLCGSKESGQTGWDIAVNVAGNYVRIGHEGSIENHNELHRLSNQEHSRRWGRCMCTQGSNARHKQRDFVPSADSDWDHGCCVSRICPREIDKQTEFSEVFGSRQFGNFESVESSQKSMTLPSKYMRHLLAVRRQIVSTLKD